jgi:hypothetical protein
MTEGFTVDEGNKILSTIYGERGYLVIGVRRGSNAPTIGSVLTNVQMGFDCGPVIQPVRVTAESTIEDFLEQQNYWTSESYNDPAYDRFYRVESD